MLTFRLIRPSPELSREVSDNSSTDEVMEGTLERALRTACWANQAVEIIDDLGEVLASRAPLHDVRPMMEEEVANVAKEVLLDAHVQGVFEQVGISPFKPSELLHDGGEKVTHTVLATFTDVAEAAKDSARGGVGVAKAAATEILRFVYWASHDLLQHKVPRKP